MNYEKVYNRIVTQSESKNRIKGKLYENHHIVPRCMGGLDNKDNLVLLTPREHFICHHLLCKIYDDDKLKYAFWMMYTMKDSHGRNYRITSSKYEILRRQFSSIKKPDDFQAGENNSQYGSFWVTDGMSSIRLKKSERIPDGYRKGRYIKGKKKRKCDYCNISYKPLTKELCCSPLCTVKQKGGFLIEKYDKIYESYQKYGSVNKAFIDNDIRYSGRRCKRFHEIRELHGDVVN